MKKLLIIAYYFPPIGGAGVQRVAKFAKYLARMGWQIEVVSVEPAGFKPFDASLKAEVTHDLIHISRVKYQEPFKFFDCLPGGWRIRIWMQNWLLFPDQAGGWLKPAIQIAETICKKNPGIPVFSTSAPYTSHLVARYLKRKYKMFWVADFRDEWTQNPYLHFPTPYHFKKHKLAEQSVLHGADAIISVTDAITDQLRELASTSNTKFYNIPNGFDPDDFKNIKPEHGSIFKMTHIGTLNPVRAKSIKLLLEQLNLMFQTGLLQSKDFTFQFIGNGSYRELGLEAFNWVKIIDYLPHQAALDVMCNSDLLVLVEPSPKAFTGKIFEYLAAKKPVLGLVDPQSPAAELIQESGTGWVVIPERHDMIMDIIIRCYRAKKDNSVVINPVEKVILQYNRAYQTQKLAEIISQR